MGGDTLYCLSFSFCVDMCDFACTMRMGLCVYVLIGYNKKHLLAVVVKCVSCVWSRAPCEVKGNISSSASQSSTHIKTF